MDPEKLDHPSSSKSKHEEQNEQEQPQDCSALKKLGWIDRLLALWILLAMAIGIILGNFVPETGPALQKGQFVGVSVPIGMNALVRIRMAFRYEMLHHLLGTGLLWKQIVYSIILNWIVAPLLMVGLAWAFLPDKPALREGLILVGIARCIAMVLVWNDLAGGDGEYCAILVAINSMLQMVLFAPLALFYLRVVSHSNDSVSVDYSTVAKSVAVFLGIPLGAAIVTRLALRKLVNPTWYETKFLRWINPLSLLGLIFTILILFASQGRRVVHQITSVLRVSAPLIFYFALIFFLTVFLSRRFHLGYKLICTQSFTAASNNFELAIAVAVATYGVNSDQALAATVGPLIEVPVLLALVYVIRWLGTRKQWEN
ncbi:MAG: hypothetical protein M1816_003080 [Peltula sp. TS41687]|nr:MAG: hypothetical protein M1816_003080 [Peltula sp. TS41687]